MKKFTKLSALDKKTIDDFIHSISLAEAMNGCLWLGDKNHRTIYVNPVYEQLSEYSLEECIGQPSDFCFDDKSKATIKEHHKLRAQNRPSQYEATMVSKSGKKIPLLISGAPTKAGGTIGIFTNLTKIKEMAENEKFLQQIILNTTEAIIATDNQGKIKFWNNGAKKLFGLTEKEVLDKKIHDTAINLETHGEVISSHKILMEEVEKRGYVYNFETTNYHKNGKKLHLLTTIRKVFDSENAQIGLILIYRDITDKKKSDLNLQNHFEAMQKAYKELGFFKRQTDYFNDLANIACSNASLDQLEKLIISAAHMLTRCDAAVLREYDQEKNILKLKQCLGTDKKWLNKNKISYQNSLLEEAINKNSVLFLNNIGNNTKHQSPNLVKSHEFSTVILIPLKINDKIIGSLSLYTANIDNFRFLETDFLEQFGRQCALALHAKNF